MRKAHVAGSAFLLCVFITTVVRASVSLMATSAVRQPPESSEDFQAPGTEVPTAAVVAGSPMTDTASTVFLPAVMRGYRARPPCTPESPFGLQIAALNQVRPGQEDVPGAMTKAEWLQFLEQVYPTLMEALEASGACWARVYIHWAWIQPDEPPAPYEWGPYHDQKLALVAETGVDMIATVGAVPEWAGPSEMGPIYDDRIPDFSQFLTDLVNRYKQHPYNIHTWELFNEPDGISEDPDLGWARNRKYAAMIAAAYTAIKAADPEATVLMGGIAYDWFWQEAPDGKFYRYFPDEVMESVGDDGHFDALNFHFFPDFADEWERWVPHGDPPTCGDVADGDGAPYEAWGIDVIAKANHFRNRMETCHSVVRPVWLTELGEHGYPNDPASLAQQARYVVQGYARALAAGVEKVIWYALVSPPSDPNAQGLLYQEDWSPKPGFYSYQTLSYELAGYQYSHTLDAADLEGYVFQNSLGAETTVVWSGGEGWLTFAPADRLRVVDREGHVTFVEDGGAGDADGVQNGAVILQITHEPVFVSE